VPGLYHSHCLHSVPAAVHLGSGQLLPPNLRHLLRASVQRLHLLRLPERPSFRSLPVLLPRRLFPFRSSLPALLLNVSDLYLVKRQLSDLRPHASIHCGWAVLVPVWMVQGRRDLQGLSDWVFGLYCKRMYQLRSGVGTDPAVRGLQVPAWAVPGRHRPLPALPAELLSLPRVPALRLVPGLLLPVIPQLLLALLPGLRPLPLARLQPVRPPAAALGRRLPPRLPRVHLPGRTNVRTLPPGLQNVFSHVELPHLPKWTADCQGRLRRVMCEGGFQYWGGLREVPGGLLLS
jgi:hypothetical protein